MLRPDKLVCDCPKRGPQPCKPGEVVYSVSAITLPDFADAALEQMPLNQINPFRLIGIFPAVRGIVEWCWDLKRLVRKSHP